MAKRIPIKKPGSLPESSTRRAPNAERLNRKPRRKVYDELTEQFIDMASMTEEEFRYKHCILPQLEKPLFGEMLDPYYGPDYDHEAGLAFVSRLLGRIQQKAITALSEEVGTGIGEKIAQAVENNPGNDQASANARHLAILTCMHEHFSVIGWCGDFRDSFNGMLESYVYDGTLSRVRKNGLTMYSCDGKPFLIEDKNDFVLVDGSK